MDNESQCRFRVGQEVEILIGRYSGDVGRVVKLEWGHTRWWITVWAADGKLACYEERELEYVPGG